MALQSSNTMLASEVFIAIRNNAGGWKAQAQNANASLAAGSVTSEFVFRILDSLKGLVDTLTLWKAAAGLDSYATTAGYVGTMSTDCTATITAAQTCISWVVTNFPNANGFLQAETLNADGSRTPRLFTPAQTAGLQTAMTSLIVTIS